jgi:hypothetical protein
MSIPHQRPQQDCETAVPVLMMHGWPSEVHIMFEGRWASSRRARAPTPSRKTRAFCSRNDATQCGEEYQQSQNEIALRPRA